MGSWGTGIFQDDHAQDAATDIRDAVNPNAVVEGRLIQFLAASKDGYDRSNHSGDWREARKVMATCGVVFLASSDAESSWLKAPGR